MKKQKGITLIALIVTISVLVILAAVAISSVTDGGVLEKSKEEKYSYEIAQEKSNLKTQVLNWQSITSHEPTLENYLDGIYGEENVELNSDNTLTVTVPSGNKYIVTEGGVEIWCDHTNTNKVVENVITATCTTEGYTGDTVCTRCGRIVTTGTTIAALNHPNTEIRNESETYTGDTYCTTCGIKLASGSTLKPKIPEGGVYYVGTTSVTLGNYSGATATYTAGDRFPNTVSAGDVYVYGDYEYRYNYYYFYSHNGNYPSEWREVSSTSSYVAAKHAASNGWGVRVLKNKDSYGEILSYINDMAVKNLVCTFDSTVLDVSPQIPETVKCMYDTFNSCNYLTTVESIPRSVTSLHAAFASCESLTGEIEINCSTLTSNSSSIYDGAGSAFYDTELEIKLTGSASSSIKSRLASSATNSNVSY